MNGRPIVLLVEDEALVRMVAAEMLAALGFDVEEASNAGAAMIAMARPDLDVCAAIIDLGLPDRRGDALAHEMRALYPDLPLVIASGYAEASMRGRIGRDAGIAFVEKPYQSKDIEKALATLGVARPEGESV